MGSRQSGPYASQGCVRDDESPIVIGSRYEWPDEIADALTNSSVFLVFVSPRSAASKNVKNEINFAFNNDKPILAVHLEETRLPSGLALRMGDIQAILRYTMNSDSYWGKLLRALSVRVQALASSLPNIHPSTLVSVEPKAVDDLAPVKSSGESPSSPSKKKEPRALEMAHSPTEAGTNQKKSKTPIDNIESLRGSKLPPSTLLDPGDGPLAVREDELREEARALVEKCAEFDVRGQVVQINPGPVVTTYEFKPEASVKYSRVIGTDL